MAVCYHYARTLGSASPSTLRGSTARDRDRPAGEGHDRLRALPQAQLQEDRRLSRHLLHRRHAPRHEALPLRAARRAISANAGKRHRPLICLLACEAVGGDPATRVPCGRGHRALPHRGAHPRRHRGLLADPPRRAVPAHRARATAWRSTPATSRSRSSPAPSSTTPASTTRTKLRVLARARRHDDAHHRGPGARHRLGARRPLRPHRRRLPAHGEPQDRVLLGRGAARGRRHRRRRLRGRRSTTLRAFGMAHGPRVPDPGRRAQPRRHARVHQEGLPLRHHRGQAHARRGPRAAALGSAASGCSRSSRRARPTAAVLDEAVAIMREAGSIEFAQRLRRATSSLDAKAALEAELPQEPRRATCSPSMADFFVKRNS